MTEVLITTIECVVAVGVGVFAGFFGLCFINRMPASWLCDYGQGPSEELKDPGVQRVKSYPWKFIMVGFMVISGVRLVLYDVALAIPAFLVLWVMMLLAILDQKYMIVPDQLVLLLAACAIGFIPQYTAWTEPVYGAVFAFGIIMLVGLIGKLIYKKNTVGGGDIKIYSALGLIFGFEGFLIIFIIATFLSAIHFAWEIMKKRAKTGDERPLVPYLFAAVAIYQLIIYELPQTIAF